MIERGDILEATNRDRRAGLHYIIFYSGKNERYFHGGMLTTSAKFKENIAMSGNHFEAKDLDNQNYKISFNNSHLVPAKLLKLEEWGPFKIVGKLTQEGVKFVEDKINDLEPITWEAYNELKA